MAEHNRGYITMDTQYQHPYELFAYQVGKDIKALELKVDDLLIAQHQCLKIVMPEYDLKYPLRDVKVDLPEHYHSSLCLLIVNNEIRVIKTADHILVPTMSSRNKLEYAHLIKFADLDNCEILTASLGEDEKRIMDEFDEQEKAAEKERLAGNYLAKYLHDNYLSTIRSKYQTDERHVTINSDSTDMLERPFIVSDGSEINEEDLTDIKQALQSEKTKAENGEVDLQSVADYEVPND